MQATSIAAADTFGGSSVLCAACFTNVRQFRRAFNKVVDQLMSNVGLASFNLFKKSLIDGMGPTEE